MKQKKSTKKQKANIFTRFEKYYKNNPKNRKYIIIAIIISIGLTYWLGAIAIEKLQFAKADKTLDNFVTDIKTELGEPSKIDKNKSCVETGDKFQINGLPSCSISYYIEYPVSSAEMANEYQTKIEPLISKNFKVKYKIQNDFIEYQNNRDAEDVYYKLASYLMSCSYRLEYINPRVVQDDDNKLIISTGCYNQKSHWNHYMVR